MERRLSTLLHGHFGLVLCATPLTEAFLRLASRRLSGNTAQRLARPVSEYVFLTFAA